MLVKQTAYISFDNILNIGFTFYITYLLANNYGVESVGEFTFLLSIYAILFCILNFSTQTFLRRDVLLQGSSILRQRILFENITFRVQYTLPIALIIFILIYNFSSNNNFFIYMYAFSLGIINIFQAYLTTLESYQKIIISRSLGIVIFAISINAFQIIKVDFLYGLILLQSFVVILLLLALSRPIQFKILEHSQFLNLLEKNLYFTFSGLVEVLILRYGVLFLGAVYTAKDVGAYAIANYFLMVAILPPLSFIKLYFNRYLRLLKSQSLVLIRREFIFFVIIAIVFSLIVLLAVMLFYRDFINIFFDISDNIATEYALFLTLYLPFLIISRMLSYFLTASGLSKRLFLTNLIALSSLVIFSILYQYFGLYMSFILAMIQSELICILINLRFLLKHKKI